MRYCYTDFYLATKINFLSEERVDLLAPSSGPPRPSTSSTTGSAVEAAPDAALVAVNATAARQARSGGSRALGVTYERLDLMKPVLLPSRARWIRRSCSRTASSRCGRASVAAALGVVTPRRARGPGPAVDLAGREAEAARHLLHRLLGGSGPPAASRATSGLGRARPTAARVAAGARPRPARSRPAPRSRSAGAGRGARRAVPRRYSSCSLVASRQRKASRSPSTSSSVGEHRSDAHRRLVEDQGVPVRRPAPGGPRAARRVRCGRKPTNRKRSVGRPETDRAAMAARGPGTGTTGSPSARASRTSR